MASWERDGHRQRNAFGRWQGYFEHVELEMMVQAGLTPMQALVAATSGSAAAMKLDQLGAIQPGKQADLLVLNADPLSDIKNTRQIHSVWVGGRRLAAVLGTNRQRQYSPFENEARDGT